LGTLCLIETLQPCFEPCPHVSIDYAYCSSGGRNGKVFGIFKVSNLDKAQKLLSEGAGNQRPERRPLRDQRAYRR